MIKKLTKLTRMLLVAAGLCVGANAWGAMTWDFTKSSVWGSITLPSEGNSYADVSYDAFGAAATTGNFITFHSTTGQIVHATTQSNGIAFKSTGSTSDNYIKMSVPAGTTVTVLGYYSGNRTLEVSFNGSTTTLTSGDWGDYSKDFVNDGVAALDMYIYCNANPGAAGNAPYLKSISLKQAVAVTINYRDKDDQENTLISSVVENVEVGTSYTPTHKTTLYVSDSNPYEYTYESGADPVTINEATTINVLYSKGDRAQYSYVVQSIKNDDKALIETLKEGTLYKGASVTVPYPSSYNIGGTLYTRGVTNKEYRQVVTPDKDNYSITFPYIAQSTSDVVYLVEGENIAGATINTSGTNIAIRASNAAAASIPAGGVAVCTLPAGTYSLHIWMSHTSNNAKVTTTFGYGTNEFTIETSGTNRVQAAAKEFTLTETSTLVCKDISGDGLLDNLYITGTPTNEIVGAVDYSTEFLGAKKDYTISKGQTLKFEFVNHGLNTQNYYNWIVRMNSTKTGYQTLRADNVVWEAGDVYTKSLTKNGNPMVDEDEFWSQFRTDMENASVKMTIDYTLAGMLSVTATATAEGGNVYVHSYAYKTAISENVSVELGVEKAWLEILSSSQVVPGTITPAGWSTFASPYPLDLSGIEGGKAYYASAANGGTVTLTTTEAKVPAGEGIMVKGTAGATFTIPVTAEATGTISGNLLKGQTTEGTVEASDKDSNGKYHYVFGYTSSSDYGFYNLADDATVPAGKAYLETSSTLGARMALVFDDESTAISTVKEKVSTDGGYYNLSGQRVAAPQKGLYIMNGKKVIIK